MRSGVPHHGCLHGKDFDLLALLGMRQPRGLLPGWCAPPACAALLPHATSGVDTIASKTPAHPAALLVVMQFGDGFNCTIGGVLRGAGRQELGALLNLMSYW